jgi:hypothetical protein
MSAKNAEGKNNLVEVEDRKFDRWGRPCKISGLNIVD